MLHLWGPSRSLCSLRTLTSSKLPTLQTRRIIHAAGTHTLFGGRKRFSGVFSWALRDFRKEWEDDREKSHISMQIALQIIPVFLQLPGALFFGREGTPSSHLAVPAKVIKELTFPIIIIRKNRWSYQQPCSSAALAGSRLKWVLYGLSSRHSSMGSTLFFIHIL